MNEISDFCTQYKYLQLEKPSGVEVEIPIHKTLAMDLLKGVSYRTSLGSDRVKRSYLEIFILILFSLSQRLAFNQKIK